MHAETMATTTKVHAGADPWQGDLLKRKAYADFLTRFLIAKTTDASGAACKPFTLALDAAWGQGKTHFITSWEQSLAAAARPYITLKFDAWQSDYLNDAVVVFMAQFKASLDRHLQAAGYAPTVQAQVKEKMGAAVSGLRRALMPAGKEILKAVLKKGTGIEVGVLVDAIQGHEKTSEELMKEVESDGMEALNKGLDTFFEKALESQEARQVAIASFKGAMRETLKLLVQHGQVPMPMFVFIDELDRARPDFAVSMLEGLKHLFDIEGVCFVVATNMEQLSHTVKAVYGTGFDGYSYLKRLFDAEYVLPPAKGKAFAHLLLSEHPEFNATMTVDGQNHQQRCINGLPERGFFSEPESNDLATAFAWAADVFELDLRSQRKVMDLMAAAATGIPANTSIHFLWLCIQSIWRHKAPTELREFSIQEQQRDVFMAQWRKLAPKDVQRQMEVVQRQELTMRKVTLADVAWVYYETSFQDMEELINEDERRGSYPQSLRRTLWQESPDTGHGSCSSRFSSIKSYPQLLATAGHFAQR
jgi:KAP family P-loop domain